MNLIDEDLPVPLAYVDADERYRYHNRAFRDWIGLGVDDIEGRTMREVLGDPVYAEIRPRVTAALGGQAVRYERTYKRNGGAASRLFIQLVPHLHAEGRVIGMFAMVFDQARAERRGPAQPSAAVAHAESVYEQALDHVLGGGNAAERIRMAMEREEFLLYGQLVRRLDSASGRYYEIYLRMSEEEENMMPPGAFLVMAEKHGLMRDLDRWTVTHVLASVAHRRGMESGFEPAAYCVPLSRESLADPHLPEFVSAELARHRVLPPTLRFQVQLADALANPADVGHLVQELRRLQCGVVLAGFGRDKVDFNVLKELPVDFLKIDGSLIYRLGRDDEAAVAAVRSINRVAQTVGIKTIAELVESEQLIVTLRRLGVDYAHGLAIGTPWPLDQIR